MGGEKMGSSPPSTLTSLQLDLLEGFFAPGDLGAVAQHARTLGYTILRKPVKPAALRALLGALLAAASHLDPAGTAAASVATDTESEPAG